ncbi:hypothetical protein C2773_10430, partial [Pasteurella multocida]|uniref:hypothetical protein n=1 Tax=Pasteurella multocida TaxID=747 RepID=UPI0016A8770E
GAVAVFLSQCFIMLNHLTLDFGQSIILNKFKTAHFSGHHQFFMDDKIDEEISCFRFLYISFQ